MASVERVIDSADQLGECPIWDERMGTLWWVDIHGRAVKRYDGENLRVLAMPEKPGSIALRREVGLLIGLSPGVYLLAPEQPQLLGKPADHAAALRFNDGRRARAGRSWVG